MYIPGYFWDVEVIHIHHPACFILVLWVEALGHPKSLDQLSKSFSLHSHSHQLSISSILVESPLSPHVELPLVSCFQDEMSSC